MTSVKEGTSGCISSPRMGEVNGCLNFWTVSFTLWHVKNDIYILQMYHFFYPHIDPSVGEVGIKSSGWASQVEKIALLYWGWARCTYNTMLTITPCWISHTLRPGNISNHQLDRFCDWYLERRRDEGRGGWGRGWWMIGWGVYESGRQWQV